MAEPFHIETIHVAGSDREIGRSHGEQLKEVIPKGMVKFYLQVWKNAVESGPKHWLKRRLFKALTFLVDPLLIRRFLSQLPPEARERIKGLSEGSGLPYDDLTTVVVLPDLFPLLQAYLARVRPQTFLDVQVPKFGCTSFLSSGEEFFYGRNLDFPGVGYWDKYPVIQSTRPKDGLRYLAFTTAGVPLGGITGMNEAQISVALHLHYSLKTSLTGHMPFFISEKILRHAKTLEEAKAILNDSKVFTSWAFIVCDGKSGEGFICEMHPTATGMRSIQRYDGVMAHSNYYQTAECQPQEYATTARMTWDNYFRRKRLAEMAGSQAPLTPELAIQAVSDHWDPYWGEEKVVNRTVGQTYNIQSLVLELRGGKAWMAEGQSPIQIRDYVEFDLGQIFSGGSGRTGKAYSGFRFKDNNAKVAKEKFISSFVAAFDHDYGLSFRELKESLKSYECAEMLQIAGILALKHGLFEEGLRYFKRGRSLIEKKFAPDSQKKFPPEYFECRLFEARALDLLGKRSDAEACYRELAVHRDLEDEHIRRIAGKEGPYRASQLDALVMPFSSYIPFE